MIRTDHPGVSAVVAVVLTIRDKPSDFIAYMKLLVVMAGPNAALLHRI
jgi:hypothetical protein